MAVFLSRLHGRSRESPSVNDGLLFYRAQGRCDGKQPEQMAGFLATETLRDFPQTTRMELHETLRLVNQCSLTSSLHFTIFQSLNGKGFDTIWGFDHGRFGDSTALGGSTVTNQIRFPTERSSLCCPYHLAWSAIGQLELCRSCLAWT